MSTIAFVLLINLWTPIRLVYDLGSVVGLPSLVHPLACSLGVNPIIIDCYRLLTIRGCCLHRMVVWIRKHKSTPNLVDATVVHGSVVSVLAIIFLVCLVSALHWRLVLGCYLCRCYQECILDTCSLANGTLVSFTFVSRIYWIEQIFMEGKLICFTVFLFLSFDRMGILSVTFFRLILLCLHHKLLNLIFFLFQLSWGQSMAW